MLSCLLVLVLTAQATQRDARPGPGTATISGRVTERDSGRPLPRIVVALEAPPATRIEAITDAEGRYEMAGLDAGEYTLSAAPERHRSTYLPLRFGEDAPAFYAMGASRPNLELKPGETRTSADLALWRALAIEGRVLDPWDQPMANVDVNVMKADGWHVPVRGATSDDVGAYRIYGLAPGRYRICARVQDSAHSLDGMKLVRTCHVAAIAEGEADDVLLISNDATGIDIRAQRVGTHAITGSVVDASGAPVDKGNVHAAPLDEHSVSTLAQTQGGHFVVTGVTPGRYLLTASVGGALPGDPNPPPREREIGHAIVDVHLNDASAGVIALVKPVTMPGIVILEGTPVPPARHLRLVIHTRPPEDRWWRYESVPPRASVDDQLRFELAGLYRVPRLIGVSNIPDGWALKSIRLAGRDITYTPADLASVPPGSHLEVVLTNEVGRPSARVTAEKEGAAPFQVLLMPAAPEKRRAGLQMIAGDRAHKGVVSLGSLVAGEYLIAALSPDDAFTVVRDPSRIGLVASVATRVTVPPGDRRTFELAVVALPLQR